MLGPGAAPAFPGFFWGGIAVFREGAAPIPNKNRDGAKIPSEFTQGRRKRSRLRNFHGMGLDLRPEPPVPLPSLRDGVPGCSRAGREEGRAGIPWDPWAPGTPPDLGWRGLEKSAPGDLYGNFLPLSFSQFSMFFPVFFPWFSPWIDDPSLVGMRSLRVPNSWNFGL